MTTLNKNVKEVKQALLNRFDWINESMLEYKKCIHADIIILNYGEYEYNYNDLYLFKLDNQLIKKWKHDPKNKKIGIFIQFIPKFYVTMTDKFMSNWVNTETENKLNKFVIGCDTYEQAEIIRDNAHKRNEMIYINICIRKPYYNPKGYYVSYSHISELSDIWTKA